MPIAGPTTNHDEIRIWADAHKAVPTEVLPEHLNHLPSVLRLMFPQMAAERKDVRVITWEEFFLKFDLLGLTFVYEQDPGGYNELLQMEEKSPYRPYGHAKTDRYH